MGSSSSESATRGTQASRPEGQSSAGRSAYEADLLRRPTYRDETPREAWDELPRMARMAWEDVAKLPLSGLTVPHARVSPPWSGPSPAWFPDTWGTLFARHATPEEVQSGSVIHEGRVFDVVPADRLEAAALKNKEAA